MTDRFAVLRFDAQIVLHMPHPRDAVGGQRAVNDAQFEKLAGEELDLFFAGGQGEGNWLWVNGCRLLDYFQKWRARGMSWQWMENFGSEMAK